MLCTYHITLSRGSRGRDPITNAQILLSQNVIGLMSSSGNNTRTKYSEIRMSYNDDSPSMHAEILAIDR